MNYRTLTAVILSLLMIAPMPASAASWSTQVVLASNAYNGSVALDANGNMVSVWYQNALANGNPVNEIWASTRALRPRMVGARQHLGQHRRCIRQPLGAQQRCR